MRCHLFISAALAFLLLGQPAALAQPLIAELQANSSELTNVSVTQETSRDEEQHSNVFDWQKQLQQIQTATSQLLEPVVANESISSIKSDFQSKISDLAMTANLTKLQEDVVSNISISLDNAQEWSKNLVADTKDAINFQEWAVELSSNLNENLQNLQEWGTGLVANLQDNASILSEELDLVQQDAETDGNPEELAAIKKAEQIAAILSKELDQIKQDAETETTPQELAEIKKAEQIAATLLEQLNRVQENVDNEANPQELAEIQQAEQMTSLLSEELNEMQQTAETTVILSEELEELKELQEPVAVSDDVSDTVAVEEVNEVPQTAEAPAKLSEELEELSELQEPVAVSDDVPDAVAVEETETQAVAEIETEKSEIYIISEEAENLEDLAESEKIPSEEISAAVSEIAEL